MPDITSDATSQGAAYAPDSVNAAALAFQGILSPPKGGGKKKPGEDSPEPKDAPADDAEPEVEETEEQPEAEEPALDENGDPVVEEPGTDDAESDTDEETEETTDEETPATKRSRKLRMPDGKEEDVSEDEAYNGYLRTADYTRKTQATAEEKKAAATERAAASEARTQLLAQLEKVKLAMDRMVPKEPNWSELRGKVSAEEFADTLSEWQRFSNSRAEIIKEQERIAGEEAKEVQKRLSDYRDEETSKLFVAIPEWTDETKRKEEPAAMASYAKSQGYTEEEINSVVDHRFLVQLRKAMLWDKAQTAGQTKVKPKIQPKGKIKAAPPGGSSDQPKPKSSEKRAKESLRQSGGMKEAAGVFSHILSRRG